MQRKDFHQLYVAHARDVHRFAAYLTGSADEADDVTAEVFLRAWAGVETIRQSTARGYLIAIARNIVRDGLRRKKRLTAITGDAESASGTPEQSLEFQQTMDALNALPQELREPLMMSVKAGMSYEDVAAELGLTLSNVKIRIFRARQRLADTMSGRRDSTHCKETR